MARNELSRDQEQAYWIEICQGKWCCICEEPFPPPYTQQFSFCLACVPDAAELPHTVGIHIDHHREGFSAHIVSQEEPPCVLWMVALTAQQVNRLLDKGRTSNFERVAARRALQQWGRTSIITHLDDEEYRWLREAVRRDPRNGYEMTRELQWRRC